MKNRKSRRLGAGPKRKTVKKTEEKSKSKSPNTCAICLEPLEKDIRKTSCNHRFHRKCMMRICDTNGKECPLCRADIEEDCDNLETGKKLLPHQIESIQWQIPGMSSESAQDLNLQKRIMRKLRFPPHVDTKNIHLFRQAVDLSKNKEKVMDKMRTLVARENR